LTLLVVALRLVKFDGQGFVRAAGGGRVGQVRYARALPALALSDCKSSALAVQTAGGCCGAQSELLRGEEVVIAVAVQHPVLLHALAPRPPNRVACALTKGFSQITAGWKKSFKDVHTDRLLAAMALAQRVTVARGLTQHHTARGT